MGSPGVHSTRSRRRAGPAPRRSTARTGTVTAPGLNEYITEQQPFWADDPELFAYQISRGSAPNERVTVELRRLACAGHRHHHVRPPRRLRRGVSATDHDRARRRRPAPVRFGHLRRPMPTGPWAPGLLERTLPSDRPPAHPRRDPARVVGRIATRREGGARRATGTGHQNGCSPARRCWVASTHRSSPRARCVLARRSGVVRVVVSPADPAADQRLAAHRGRRAHADLRADRFGQDPHVVPCVDRSPHDHATARGAVASHAGALHLAVASAGVRHREEPPCAAQGHRARRRAAGAGVRRPRGRNAHRRHAVERSPEADPTPA